MAAEAKKKRSSVSTIHDSPVWKSSHSKESNFYHRGRHVSDENSFRSLPTQPHSMPRRKSTSDDVISHPLRNESSLSSLMHVPRKISMDPSMDPEELLNSGVKSVLRTYTEISAKPNVQEINEKVTWIYETVEKAVVSMLKAVTMEQGDSAADCIEYTVIPPSIVATFKGSDEADKNLTASCSSTPTVSPTPCSSSSSSSSSSKRPDSVETNTSGLHSATSQKSSHSSVSTNTSAPQSASSNDYTSRYCREDIDNENTSSTITDNTSLVAQPYGGAPESVTEVRMCYYIWLYVATHIYVTGSHAHNILFTITR